MSNGVGRSAGAMMISGAEDDAPRPVLQTGVYAARGIARGVAAMVLLIAAGSLLHHAGAAGRHPLPANVFMTPAGALLVGLLALALLCLNVPVCSPRRMWLGRLAAALAGVGSLFAVLAHAGVTWGWASTMVSLVPGLAAFGRLLAVPAAGASILALALILLHRSDRLAGRLVVLMALGCGLIGLLGVLGYLYGAPSLYQSLDTTPLAPTGAFALLLLSVGVWCAQPDRGLVGLLVADDAGGASLRRLLPAVLLMVPALVLLRMAGERAGLFGDALGGAVFAAGSMVLLGGLLSIDAAWLSRLHRRQRAAEGRRAALAAGLEQQVAERTSELSHINAELRQEVAERRRAEGLFQSLFDGAPTAVTIIDIDGLIQMANAQTEVLFGYPAQELLGRPVEVLVPAVQREQRRPQDVAAPQRQILAGMRKDGTQPMLEIFLSPVQLGDRQLSVMAIHDITTRQMLERERAEAERRFRDLVTNVPVGVFVYRNAPDPEGRFLEINPAFLDIVEADSQDEALQIPASRLFDEPSALALLVERLLTEGRLSGEEFWLRTLKGRLFWARVSAVCRRAADGNVYFDGVLEDVTQRKQIEQRIHDLNEQLAQRAAELETTNHELEAFSYSVSHDLRAPLRAIDGFSRILEQDLGERLDEDNRDRLARVRNNAQRMGTLIDDLLSLARVARVELRRQPVDLGILAADIVAGLRESDPDRDVNVVIGANLRAWGDASLLRLALQNLLDNAWKFTRHTEQARIEFTFDAAAPEPAFVIRDNGAGFDMAYADKLFGAFQRLHGIGEFPGTGVGLATVQRIIHKHGGRIWARAQPQQGASFYFTLTPEDMHGRTNHSAG